VTVKGEIKRVPEGSKYQWYHKTYLILECDVCGKEFEQGNNIKVIRARPRHYCSASCFSAGMQKGGIADQSRTQSCMEKCGHAYAFSTPEVLAANKLKSHTPESEHKRKIARKQNHLDTVWTLSRGLQLPRSREEIRFLSELSQELGAEIQPQKHAGRWWIDGYCPAYDVWIQYDGVYWHKRYGSRDVEQNEWFISQRKHLFRITDVEYKADPVGTVKTIAHRIKELGATSCTV
jgi:very-short-patch-repair endonuclease